MNESATSAIIHQPDEHRQHVVRPTLGAYAVSFYRCILLLAFFSFSISWIWRSTNLIDWSATTSKTVNLTVRVEDLTVTVEECEPFNPSSCLKPWSSRNDVPEEWLIYLTYVYGKKGVKFPFDPTSLKFFYSDYVPFRDNATVVKYKERTKVPYGHLYECGWTGRPNFWCVHAFGGESKHLNKSALGKVEITPYGQPSNGYLYVPRINEHEFITPGFWEGQRVEVTHECCDSFKDSEGMWFFHNPGSGVYLQLGRTLTFRNKPELCENITKSTNTYFDCQHVCCGPLHRYLIPHLRRMGIETVVLTDSVPGEHVSSVEIWEVRETRAQVAPSSCAPVHEDALTCKDCTARFLFHGFDGTEPCTCDESHPSFLRCVPQMESEPLTAVVTGDVHGYIDGVPILSKFIHQRQKANPLVLLGAGDFFLGSTFFQKNGPIAFAKMICNGDLQYDAIGLGNHDLEFYKDLSAFASETGSPLVCFNLHNLPGVVPWVRLLALPHLSACATGFTTVDHGIINETALEYASPGGELFWREFRAVLSEMNSDGCKLIFILGHGGLKLDNEVAEKTSPSVVVLGGHDHDIVFEESYLDTSRIVMHAGAELLQAGVLELNLTIDPRSGAMNISDAHSEMLTLVDEASRLNGNDGPILMEISRSQDKPPFHSRDCRQGRCPLGDTVAELMFLAAACERNATDVVVGALREAGSMRSSLGVKVTESELRDVLLWNNDLVVVELHGRDIYSMLNRSRESIAHDGGGAALSLFGVRMGAYDKDVEVLTEMAAREHCLSSHDSPRSGANLMVVGPGSKDTPLEGFRHLKPNETVFVTVTNWLWEGGDGFVAQDVPPIRTVGPEVDVILSLLPTSTYSDTGILGAALGAVVKGFMAALVYGCSRAQTRDIVFGYGPKHPRFSFMNLRRVSPCTCRPGCLITTVAVGIGHFLFWGILRSCLRYGMHSTILASMIAAFIVAVVENPLWVIITRIQAADYNMRDEAGLPKENDSLPPNWLASEQWHFFDVASIIWASKGLKGFFDGLLPNLLLILNPILQANLYFICVRALASFINQNDVGGGADEQDLLSSIPWLSVIAGIASTAGATLITYPLQVIRIRLQMNQSPFVGHYYDGIEIKGLQAIFSSSITFFFMDYVAYHVRSLNPGNFFSSLSVDLGD